MDVHQLTPDAINSILRDDVDSGSFKPVIQLLGFKKISNNNSQDRYRVMISDGVSSNGYTMLATQMNDKVEKGDLTENSICKLDQYVTNIINTNSGPRKLIILLDLKVLVPGSKSTKIGSPVENTQKPTTPVEGFSRETPKTPASSAIRVQNKTPSSADSPKNYLPIIGINPYQNRWTIKARVVLKSNIRTWSNARGEGKLFSADLMDESGTIRVTAFNDAVDKYYDMLELNRVYLISRCTIKPANKKFCTTHDFELSVNNDSSIVPCSDNDDSIPSIQFNFTPLGAIKDIAPDSIVDIIGVCKSVSDMQTVIARASKKELKKRDVHLVDQTNASVAVTLWDAVAEEFDASLQPVIAIKSGCVTEFNGAKSISLGISSTMQKNPDIKEAHLLRGWFELLPEEYQFDNISIKTGADVGGKVYTFKEASINQVGAQDKADYFNVEGTILFIQHERAIYQACPTKDCQKKVIDQNTGMYRCEKCNEDFPSFKHRFMLTMQICDWTGFQWVTMFHDTAESFLGVTAEMVANSKESQGESYESYFHAHLFKQFIFRIRAKMDTYNGESRLRMIAVAAKPIDFKESCKRMISEIKRLS